MPQQFHRLLLSPAGLLAFTTPVFASKFAIVTDDFGYHLHTENQVPAMPSTISIAILPNAPHAREMTIKAHNSGHEVLIHLPMVLLSKQSLEKDTLRPEMSSEEVERTIRDVVSKVLNAVGLNNHMGSVVTSSLFGMQKVTQALERYDLCFLDNTTIGNSQVVRAASGTSVKVIKRKVFLDDTQNEADIRCQFNRTVELAHRNGSATVIGHPHLSTVRTLQQMLYSPSADITPTRPSSLLSEPQVGTSRSNLTPPKNGTPDTPRNPFHGAKLCKPKQSLGPVYANRFFSVLGESITQSTLVQYMRLQWQGWQ